MKLFTLLIFLTLSNQSFSDTTKTREKLFLEKVNALEILHKSYADSLNKELTFYRLKEDYFTEALGEQANRFSLIIASILGFVGLVTFSSFRNEVKKMQKNYETQVSLLKKELNLYVEKSKEHDNKIQVVSGNFFTLAADVFIEKGDFILALELCLAAAHANSLAVRMPVEDNQTKDSVNPFTYAINNMKSAMQSLNNIKEETSNEQILKDKSQELFNMLKVISECNNLELEGLCAECRVEINKFIKNNTFE